MKIMRVLDKKVGKVTYYKYRINLPKQIVEDSGLLNKELKVDLDDNKIIIDSIFKAINNNTHKERRLQKELIKLMNNKSN